VTGFENPLALSIYAGTQIQICVRKAPNIVAVWHVRMDGRYGVDT
jgi:hypothetical protein